MDIVTKLASKAAGVLFAKLTGSKEGADACSTMVEWLVGRTREPKTATIKTLSGDIANTLAATIQQAPGQPDADAVIDNAFEAIAAGPTVDQIVADHRRAAGSAAAAARKILDTRFKAKSDPAYERAVVLIGQFYEVLLKHPKFAEFAEPSFQRAVLADFRSLRDAVDKVYDGIESLETLQLGLPADITASLRRTASNLLLDAKRSTWKSSDSRLSLLLATNRVIEFERRDDVLNDLRQWCEGKSDLDLRLIFGPGGTGKTRLLIEACDQLWRDLGWRAGFLRPTSQTHRDTLYRALLDDPKSLLVVFDYAELRIEEVQDFVASAHQRRKDKVAPTTSVRIVLLSREGGDWWTKALPARRDEVTDFFTDIQGRPDALRRLSPIADQQPDRAALFSKWRKTFAERLGTESAIGVSEEWQRILAQRGMDRSLFIALAALSAVDSQAGEIPRSIEDLLRRTIANERRLWIDHLGKTLSDPASDALAAITLLMGSPDRDRTRTLIRALPSFEGQPQNTINRVFDTLHTLYPDESHRGVGAVQPDLIGEYLIDQRMRDEPSILDCLLKSQQNVRATLTTLTRMTRSWRSIVPSVSKHAKHLLERAIESHLADCVEAAIDVALSTGDPSGQALATAIRIRGNSDIAKQALVYAHSHTSVGRVDILSLREVNAEASLVVQPAMRAAVVRHIEQSGIEVANTELANFTTNLAVFLSRLGRREDALVAAQEATDLYRALAKVGSEVFTSNLATSLNNLSIMLSALNQRKNALVAAQEAADLHRALADARPEVHIPNLAISLNNLANRLSDLNRLEDALTAAQEAVSLRRALATARAGVSTSELAGSLTNLSTMLSDLNRREDALAAAREAADIYRTLADARPEIFIHDLAGSLTNLANMLSALDRPNEAFPVAQQAADLFRTLADARPEVFTPYLAMALNNLTNVLRRLNRRADALAAIQEAIRLRKVLADSQPEVFGPDLATSFGALGHVLLADERLSEAAAALRDGLSYLLPYFRRAPEALGPLAVRLARDYSMVCDKIGEPTDDELLRPLKNYMLKLES